MALLFVTAPSTLHLLGARRLRYSEPSAQRRTRAPPTRAATVPTGDSSAAASPAVSATPLPPVRNGKISTAGVLEQAASAIRQHSGRLLTIDFPPGRAEARSGTLVARYEHNLSFAEDLVTALSGNTKPVRVGGAVNIRDNVNPQGGGEYLDDDETLVGARAGKFTVALNAGVDAATLREVRDLDDGGTLVLLNCGVDRLSWFDRRALRGALDGFECAYYLKAVAGGFVLRAAPHPWMAFVVTKDSFDVVFESEERPKISDVEAVVRTAAAKRRQ